MRPVCAPGWRDAGRTGSRSTPHALRHFYATSILASTQNLRLTQVLMRHATPATTARYAAVGDRDAVAAVQGLRRVAG